MIRREDLLSNAAFIAVRPQRERLVVAAAALRRVPVGPNLTLLFENRETVLWQIQEMCRVENIHEPAAVQHEVDTYTALLPGPSELSATLLVEFPEADERDRMLRALLGLHEHLFLQAGGERTLARFDDEQFNDTRISSVQFVRFRLSPAQRAALFDLHQAVQIEVDHPAYQAAIDLSGPTRGALASDLVDVTPAIG